MSATRLLTCALILSLAGAASAATFTVTSSAETGPGSLKQAILDANATPGRDQIRFAVAAATIEDIGLPAITDAVDIDGFLGDGSRVVISMPLMLDITAGFKFYAGSSTSTLANVIMDPVPNASLLIESGVQQVTVTNNVFRSNVIVSGDLNVLESNTIFSPAEIRVSGDGNQFFLNSFPRISLFATASGNVIGAAGTGNTLATVISSGSLLTVEGNTFVAGAGAAIAISNPLVPGGTIAGNSITAHATGISIVGTTGYEIRGNSIVNVGIAIDLDANGATPNDPAPDADLGANNLQNFPVLTSATLAGGSLTVGGTLTSAPLTTYRIELFADAADGDVEPRTPLGTFDVTTDAAGNAAFTQTINAPLPAPDDAILSTATNLVTRDTSEVSAPIVVDAPGELSFSAATYNVSESTGSATITVNRTGGTDGTVTVQYATQNGTATAPADYAPTTGTLIFGPGVTTQQFVVPLVSDEIPEGEESFTVTLTNPTGGATLGVATATVVLASHLQAEAIPTASTWALLVLAAALAAITLSRIAH